MKRYKFTFLAIQIFCLSLMLLILPLLAQDGTEVASDEETASEDEITLTDEEIDALLTRVDNFFYDQDMAGLTVDIDILRDPSNRLNDDNIRDANPARIAGLSTIISHFTYNWPEFYELKVMGETLASSELPTDQTFFSQLLPMPGAPIYTESLRGRFKITFEGTDEVDGTDVYKIRYYAVDHEIEFFNYIMYYISIEDSTILKVESSFDNYWYVGTGQGNFYYDDWLGKYLPIYGHGTVVFQNPVRRFNVWGRWYRWNWQSAEELETESGTVEPIVDETLESTEGDSEVEGEQ